jgi:hypothetical protein
LPGRNARSSRLVPGTLDLQINFAAYWNFGVAGATIIALAINFFVAMIFVFTGLLILINVIKRHFITTFRLKHDVNRVLNKKSLYSSRIKA